ncbi:MAG: metal ABC transporter ATP-binding protein [Erysipelotrichaceae bacterium]
MSYGKNHVLDDLNLTIYEQDYIAIVGPNGSGKTTLIRALTGILKEFEGEIRYGKVLEKGGIGYLPQRVLRFDENFPARVEEVVACGLLGAKRGFKRISDQDRSKIVAVLASLGIEHLLQEQVSDLSGGQQQRVLLARALVGNPALLILDEPTSALDAKIRKEFYAILKELNEARGITILLVSHDFTAVERQAKKLLYLGQDQTYYGDFTSFIRSKLNASEEDHDERY